MQRLKFSALDLQQPHFHCAWTRVGIGERTFRHTHDFPELFLVTSGRGRHLVNGVGQELADGDLVWIEADDAHGFEGLAPGGLRFINLAIEPGWWDGFRRLFNPACDPASVRASRAPAVCRLKPDEFSRVETALRALLMGRHVEDWLLILALREALPAILHGHGDADDPVPRWLGDLAALMRSPELVAKPIGWWQAKAGCSKSHLARCCRKHFGRTLTETLAEARIAEAQARLLLGRKTVTAIAAEVGFENLGHFHSVFKHRTGCTPVEWQRRQANSTVPR
jgi:AraC family cel operon transcriptional repressor